jgi:hypothetical protein
MVVWCSFSHLGIFYQQKSGNPISQIRCCLHPEQDLLLALVYVLEDDGILGVAQIKYHSPCFYFLLKYFFVKNFMSG